MTMGKSPKPSSLRFPLFKNRDSVALHLELFSSWVQKVFAWNLAQMSADIIVSIVIIELFL